MGAFLPILILASILIGNDCAEDPRPTDFDDIINGLFNTGKDYTNTGSTTQIILQPLPTTTPIPEPYQTPNTYKSCGFEKECVPRFLCQNDTINTDGTNIIDIRVWSEDCNYLEECCDLKNKRPNPIIQIDPETRDGCGYRNPEGVGYRIVGNTKNEAEFGEFPWMIAVLKEEDMGNEVRVIYECGGAMIAPNAIITAAHCVKNRQANELFVRAGEWDTQTEAEILPYKDERVKEIILHEKFNKGSLWNDIAILILEAPIPHAQNIRPICLPDSTTNFDFSRCFTTGWGKDQFGREGVYQSILKRIDLPIVSHEQCEMNLRTTRVGKYFNLHESFICAGGEKSKDACTGDGGSPLACPVPGVKDRYYHAGIVAWGIGCGEVNIPGVYANVAYLRPWIDQQLLARGIDLKHFTILN